MMGLRDIVRMFWFGPGALRVEKHARDRFRAYAAAQVSRLEADWTTSERPPDADIYSALKFVRVRARERCQNDDYAKRYMKLVRTNVVGHNGFKFQSNVKEEDGKTPDSVANTIIEHAWRAWTRPENCSVTGRHSFRRIQQLVVEYAARDGEFLVRKIADPESRFGLRLEILPVEGLDELYNERLPGGNVVKMGVELDRRRRPMAYHLRVVPQEHEVYGSMISTRRERISAAEILHEFDQEYVNQTRGISWLVQSMKHLKMLNGYEEAALVNARVAAAKMGFFVTPADAGVEYTGSGEDSDKNIIASAEPGMMEQLPPGLDFKTWEPEFPTAQHEMFMKQTLRGIASGLGVSYNMLANDLERVNYSSIRAGLVDEREMWKVVQQWFVETFLEPVFSSWLELSMMGGAVKLPLGKFEKFNAPHFVGRRWAWVDPLKDVEAKILEVQAGLTTATQVIAEMGEDIEEVYAELEWEKTLKEKHGLTLKLDEVKLPSGQFASDELDEATSLRILEAVRDLLREKRTKNPTNGELQHEHAD